MAGPLSFSQRVLGIQPRQKRLATLPQRLLLAAFHACEVAIDHAPPRITLQLLAVAHEKVPVQRVERAGIVCRALAHLILKERRVGKGCVSTCRSRGWTCHEKKK